MTTNDVPDKTPFWEINVRNMLDGVCLSAETPVIVKTIKKCSLGFAGHYRNLVLQKEKVIWKRGAIAQMFSVKILMSMPWKSISFKWYFIQLSNFFCTSNGLSKFNLWHKVLADGWYKLEIKQRPKNTLNENKPNNKQV
jgi:hypothetical protein